MSRVLPISPTTVLRSPRDHTYYDLSLLSCRGHYLVMGASRRRRRRCRRRRRRGRDVR